MSERRLSVSGMTCGHCANAVTEELTALDSVQSVNVELVPDGVSTVVVDVSGELSDEQITTALAEAGDYRLV